MRILMVASEVSPFAKTGGLADVLGALPPALGRLGHLVDIVLPRFRGVPSGTPCGAVRVHMGGKVRHTPVEARELAPGVRLLTVTQDDFYDRDDLYGTATSAYPDNAQRFAFLAHAALAWAAAQRERYDVIHTHDWQAGLVPALLASTHALLPGVGGTPTVCTIHNLAYQGIFDVSVLPTIGLGVEMARLDAMEFWGQVSFLKGALQFSTRLTTVSPRYAEEIQTPEFGCGLDGVVRYRAADLVGILNGIDYDRWNPERDVHLPAAYSASNLTGKGAAKRRLLETVGLPVSAETLRRPVVGLISRLVEQKGFDLLEPLAPHLAGLDATFVLLGSGDPRFEDMWRWLAAEHPDRIAVRIGFDEALAHLIEGGSDLFLMPSRFEPCGLNQMYSLRYGTVPLVRDVGGLHDTVRNYDERTGEGTGFTFTDYSPDALLGTLRWALGTYRDSGAWSRIQQAGMREDHSWDASARVYVRTYEQARDRSDGRR